MTRETKITIFKWVVYAVLAYILIRTIIAIADRFANATGDFYDRLTNSLSGGFGWLFGQGDLDAQGKQLSNQIRDNATSDYAPNGRVYNLIAAQRGKKAAEDAWATVQDHLATMP